ncbi:hypothetical protein [Streptomyces sp. NPDC055036]
MEISERFDVIETPPGRFGPQMREHKRVINGKTFLFFQQAGRWGTGGTVKTYLIKVAVLTPSGFNDIREFHR